MKQQISHFKLLEEIGSGGMGIVYRARDLRLHRQVALKVLPAGALAEPMTRERLVREAQTASALNHPHIVTVYEIHSAGDRDFIAMEYVEGHSLDRELDGQQLELEQALRLGIQIADGLACAHEHGVIHRDLKPQNVMVTAGGEAKILDFGLAKRFAPPHIDGKSSSFPPGVLTLTAPGVRIGTPAYMSPEQIESQPADERSDVFSFGCLLYEMLTGTSPFRRRNAVLIFKAVIHEDPEPVSALQPNLPEALNDILATALAKDPEKRYQNMGALLRDLEQVHADLFGTGVYLTGAVPVRSTAQTSLRGPLLAVAAALLVLAGVLAWLGRRPPLPAPSSAWPLSWGFQGSQHQATFDPGGDRLAFVSEDEQGVPQLWIAASGAEAAPRQLTFGAAGVERPRFARSGDPAAGDPAAGDRLVFAVPGDGIWSLAAPFDGEPVQLLERGSSPDVSPDGRRLAFERDQGVWLADADGSQAQPLANVPPAFFARWIRRSPAISPDGRQLAYFQPEIGSWGHLWVAPIGGGTPRQLTRDLMEAGDPRWTPEGDELLARSAISGEMLLVRVSVDDGELRHFTTGDGAHLEPVLSPDGREVVYTAALRDTYSLKRRHPGSPAEVVLHESPRLLGAPQLSPGGEHIAFFAPAGGEVHLFVSGVDGSRPRQLTRGAGGADIMPQWSGDGSHLYYFREAPAPPSLSKVPAAGGESTEVLPGWSWGTHFDARVSPDGRRVVYLPVVGGAAMPTRIHDIAGGGERSLGIQLLSPRWSPDGGRILGSDPRQLLVLCSAADGGCESLVPGFEPHWAADGETAYFARRGDRAPPQELEIWRLELTSRAVERLAALPTAPPLVFGYGVLPDGEIVWNQLRPGLRELRVKPLE